MSDKNKKPGTMHECSGSKQYSYMVRIYYGYDGGSMRVTVDEDQKVYVSVAIRYCPFCKEDLK